MCRCARPAAGLSERVRARAVADRDTGGTGAGQSVPAVSRARQPPSGLGQREEDETEQEGEQRGEDDPAQR